MRQGATETTGGHGVVQDLINTEIVLHIDMQQHERETKFAMPHNKEAQS